MCDTYQESMQTTELLKLRLLAEERRMRTVKLETQETSPRKPAEVFIATHQHRRGNYHEVRQNSSWWQTRTQQNSWRKRQNVYCDFPNRRTCPKNAKIIPETRTKHSSIC